MNPGSDPLGAGYNIIQSKIALGSGGSQARGFCTAPEPAEFLPEKQTDFVFTIIAEEFGFAGSIASSACCSASSHRLLSRRCDANHQYGRLGRRHRHQFLPVLLC